MDKRKNKVSTIVKIYRGDSSLRAFAKELSAGMSMVSISGQSIHHWERGKFLPEVMTMLEIYTTAEDWRRQFAEDILAVINPDVFDTIKRLK